MFSRLVLLGLCIAGVIPLSAAPLALGTKIGLDFGPTATNVAGNDWNEISTNTTLAAGSVRDLNAAVVDGVSVIAANGQFWNNDGTDNWVALSTNPAVITGPKLPAEFVDSVITDIAGNYSTGDAVPYTITVNGLNPAYAYQIVAASTAGAGGTVVDTYNITGAITYGPSAVTRSNAHNNGVWHLFPSVVPTTAGTITIRVSDTSAGTNPITNGILITAVQYPDDDSDGLPNHWEILNSLSPTDNTGINGADGDPDSDTFTNLQEYQAGSNPQVAASTPADVDGDGLADSWETANFGNLTQTGTYDYDGDLATNEQEETANSDPKSALSWPDSDGDGMNDRWEIVRFTDLSHDGTADTDNDTWTDKEEHDALSDPGAAAWTPVLSSLAHRWSFNGDLTDSAGSSPATIVEVGANNVTLNPTNVSIAGGTRSISDYVSLGSNLLAGKASPVTIELWATQNSVQNYGRIFDFGSSTGEFLLMTWSNGTDVNGDSVRWQDTANFQVTNSCAPYTTGTEFHIVMTVEPGKGTAGTTKVTWWRAASSATDLGPARGSFSIANTLVNFNDSLAALARSQFAGDGTASATYNEVRIWNGALSAWQREALHDQNADNAAILDTDGDGLPDSWEIAYGLNHTIATGANGATGDPDGDGTINRDEFAAGTNPSDVRWSLDDDGNWSTGTNWLGGAAPNGAGDEAILDDTFITGPVTITLDAPVTLGGLVIDSFMGYTLSGANPLTIDDNGASASLQVIFGDPVVQAALVLEDPLAIDVAAGMSLTIDGSIANGTTANSLTKTGAGQLLLGGNLSAFTGPVAISGGSLILTRAGDFTLPNNLSGTNRLTHRGGGILTLSGTNSHGGTDVSAGGTLSIAAPANFGNGGVFLDDATLLTSADVDAGTRSFGLGSNGGILDIASGTVFSSLPFTSGISPLEKKGAGTWRIQPGAAASVGLLTISAGSIDLNRNDTFGNHTASNQDLLLEPGTIVSNGTSLTAGFNSVRNLTLRGAEWRVTGTARAMADGDLYRFEAYAIKETVTVEGATPSSITNPGAITNAGINLGGTTTPSATVFQVADVTGDSNADLTVSAVLKDNYTASYARLANGLVKTGPGTMLCSAVNRYTGNTEVAGGTLTLAEPCLADTADVVLAPTATLELAHAATDTIDELIIDGVPQATGTWGAPGNPAAQHTSPRLSGSGLLQVSTGPASSYLTWAAGFPGFSSTAPDADSDGDGLENGIEYVTGGDPTINDAAGIAPTSTLDGTDLVFTYRRSDLAKDDPNATITVQYGTGLDAWTTAVDGTAGVSIAADNDHYGLGIDRVTVRIPLALASDGKLFCRLKIVLATP